MKSFITFVISPTHYPLHLTTIQLITPQTAGILLNRTNLSDWQ